MEKGNSGKISLSGLTPSEIEAALAELRLPRFRARQVAEWLYKHQIFSFDEMTNLSLELRHSLAGRFTLGRSRPCETRVSADGTEKYLFKVDDGNVVEAVYIPSGDDRATLCVSSEVGCRMACRFCATGGQGFGRRLSAGEILAQIYGCPHWEELSNIVFMGQGEPMDNIDEVLRATHIVCADYGMAWSPKRITVSTIGQLDGLGRFLEESKCQLAISLHFADPAKRLRWMPVERKWSIRQVIKLLRRYDFCVWNEYGLREEGSRQRRLSFEYILFADLNDSEDDALMVAKLLEGLDCRVNLINLHSTPATAKLGLHRATDSRAMWFRDRLTEFGLRATIRASRGEDVEAACGLLRAKVVGDK